MNSTFNVAKKLSATAVALAAHTTSNAPCAQEALVVVGSVLTASVGVMNQSGPWITRLKGHAQGTHCQRLVNTRTHRPTHARLEYRSRMTHRYSQPSRVHTYVISPTQATLGRVTAN